MQSAYLNTFKRRWFQKQNSLWANYCLVQVDPAWVEPCGCLRNVMVPRCLQFLYQVVLMSGRGVWHLFLGSVLFFLSLQLPQYRCFLRNPGCQLASEKSEMTPSWLLGEVIFVQTTRLLLLAKLLALILIPKTIISSRFRRGRGPSVLPFAFLVESEDYSEEKLIAMQRWNLFKP